MTLSIPSHDVGHPAYAITSKKFPERRARAIARIEKNPMVLGSALNSLYLQARVSLAVDPECGLLETWEAWTTAMQVANAVFAVSTVADGAEVEYLIDHGCRHLEGVGPQYFTNVNNWTKAFFLAVTCRDEKRWRKLCEIPVESLREAGERKGTKYNEYAYHWVAALQALVLNRPGLAGHLGKAIELSDPCNGAFGGDIVDLVAVPQMNVFRFFVAEDSDGFNQALAKGLEKFKGYFTANRERAEDIDGAVPLGLLALACWAHDRSSRHPDFKLEVESGYLPKYILDGGWFDEFPV